MSGASTRKPAPLRPAPDGATSTPAPGSRGRGRPAAHARLPHVQLDPIHRNQPLAHSLRIWPCGPSGRARRERARGAGRGGGPREAQARSGRPLWRRRRARGRRLSREHLFARQRAQRLQFRRFIAFMGRLFRPRPRAHRRCPACCTGPTSCRAAPPAAPAPRTAACTALPRPPARCPHARSLQSARVVGSATSTTAVTGASAAEPSSASARWMISAPPE